jgi:uncharacterized protein YfaT (DUF1175 family)
MESITKWLKQSGMKANKTKTEVLLFYQYDIASIILSINNSIVPAPKAINMLDAKLNFVPEFLNQSQKPTVY